jgi:hypothetical protein
VYTTSLLEGKNVQHDLVLSMAKADLLKLIAISDSTIQHRLAVLHCIGLIVFLKKSVIVPHDRLQCV